MHFARAKPYLRKRYNVREIGIFGSYAGGEQGPEASRGRRRAGAGGEQGPESDLDIPVELDEPIGWDVVDEKEDPERIPGLPVDLAIKGKITRRPRLMRAVEAEAMYVGT